MKRWLKQNWFQALIAAVAIYGAALSSYTQFFVGPLGPSLDFDLVGQHSDQTLELYVSNTGDRHAVIERIDVCGIGEFIVQDTEFEHREWLRSEEEDDRFEIDALLRSANQRWVAQCFTKARHPRLIRGSRSIQPDSAESLFFAAVTDLAIKGTVATGQAAGMGSCSITLWANGGLHVSRIFLCHVTAPS